MKNKHKKKRATSIDWKMTGQTISPAKIIFSEPTFGQWNYPVPDELRSDPTEPCDWNDVYGSEVDFSTEVWRIGIRETEARCRWLMVWLLIGKEYLFARVVCKAQYTKYKEPEQGRNKLAWVFGWDFEHTKTSINEISYLASKLLYLKYTRRRFFSK